jgi:hypothetical protein
MDQLYYSVQVYIDLKMHVRKHLESQELGKSDKYILYMNIHAGIRENPL